ncbi:hypothetical protein [Chitinophaga sp. GbtcB8]|uniref:hypothetical protein n=1 Tax=Chitinophaga sp. GbtcB8 TaxID=2824753 RepID=UPI001C303AFF|nr:hypothetical protein [Chitinophaga sp. GbtcB8]
MKRLIHLFLACFFFLSQQGGDVYPHQQAVSDATAYITHTPAQFPTRAAVSTSHRLTSKPEYFKRRPVGLNDGHDHAPVAYSYYVRPEFVYIHTCYHCYAQTFITVSIDLRDWRGPPMA